MKTQQLTVYIRKITFGRDGRIHFTIHYPKATNFPTLVFTQEDIKNIPELKELVFKNYENK